jgi:hypothetical protein
MSSDNCRPVSGVVAQYLAASAPRRQTYSRQGSRRRPDDEGALPCTDIDGKPSKGDLDGYNRGPQSDMNLPTSTVTACWSRTVISTGKWRAAPWPPASGRNCLAVCAFARYAIWASIPSNVQTSPAIGTTMCRTPIGPSAICRSAWLQPAGVTMTVDKGVAAPDDGGRCQTHETQLEFSATRRIIHRYENGRLFRWKQPVVSRRYVRPTWTKRRVAVWSRCGRSASTLLRHIDRSRTLRTASKPARRRTAEAAS